MSTIDVGTPGFSIDITCAEVKFNGQTLSTGIEKIGRASCRERVYVLV